MTDLLQRIASILTDEELREMVGSRLDVSPPASDAAIRVPGVWHEYATVDAWNRDRTAMLLFHEGGFVWLHYDDGRPYLQLSKLIHSSEPRWSRLEANVFYYVSGNEVRSFNTGMSWDTASRLHRRFDEYVALDAGERNGVRGRGESELSADGDHLALSGTRPDGIVEVFVYEISTDTKSAVIEQTEHFNNLKIDSRNRAIIARSDGHHLVSGSRLTRENGSPGHSAPAQYEGKDYLVWCSSNSLNLNANAVVMVDIDDLMIQHRMLWADRWDYALHISTCNKPFCLVSTYTRDGVLPSQIWKVQFDRTTPTLLQDLGNIAVSTYENQPKASLSHDGSRYVYTFAGDSYLCRLP
jgi:hypothetical protein